MKIVYLDTSAIVKRYVQETGSDIVTSLYSKAWAGDVKVAFSLWNIGEVLGVLDEYYRRGWLRREDYELARLEFLGEILKMLKLRILKAIPVKTSLITKTWRLVEKYHIYQADALQVVSAREVNASEFYTADQTLCKVASEEQINTTCLAE
ncbi:MAG: type II toxin-antitoxin system VapC family toxin [Desulfurococcaceae archaeon]|jgi:predicted nucleic acid-binding protein|nr:type II toxin-antitoxin system VapC family toxin [Desulfurococcaceae archaeon]